MDDLRIIEAVEKYITGQMSPDERVYFEQLRKTNPEIDQMVVEHTFFMQQLNRFEDTRKFKATLNDIHTDLSEKGLIRSPKLRGKAKVAYMFNRYKRTAAIAASIAGLTALCISALVWMAADGTPASSANLRELSRKIDKIEDKQEVHDRKIDQVAAAINTPVTTYKTGGTAFLVDQKGFVVTNAHIVQNANGIVIQNNRGKEFRAEIAFIDKLRDVAILKIIDTTFRSGSIPYSIKKTSAKIAEQVYTLGFPRNDVAVYGEGYMAAQTGFNGDTLTCQISIAANPGNSGGPILNKNGDVIGILSTRQTGVEGVVFAIQAKYIHMALSELQKKDPTYSTKLPTASKLKGMDKTQQVEKITDFVYMVKVS
jgi:serine protease Do